MGRYNFKLPDVGEGSAEAELVGWQVEPGDTIVEDQPVVEVMTDKASVEIPSPAAGTVVSVVGAPGEMLAVGSVVLVLEVDGPGNAGDEAAPSVVQPQPETPPAAEPPAGTERTGAPAGEGNYVFKLPDVGEGSAEAELVGWQVEPGDTIVEDQPVVEVMTDKASVEIPSPATGTVVWVKGAPGEMLAVGSDILILQVAGPGNMTAAPVSSEGPSEAPSPAAVAPARATVVPAETPERRAASPATKPGFATRTPGEKPVASPAVRRRAWEHGVQLQFVPGSGPGGRITQDDLDAYVESGGALGTGAPTGRQPKTGTEDVKVIGLRRTIAKRMQDAKRRIPHFSYVEEVDVTDLEALRVTLNAQYAKDRGKLTLLPFLAKAMVRTLPDYPQINARFHDDDGFVRRYDGVHLGIATQTPTGLVVPVVHHAEALTLWECGAEVARLAAAAREGKASRDELSGSTITITSLGALGGLATTPVINYPEVAIVGVNKMIERPVVRGGQIVVRKIMNLSSSFDHRVVDGWDAAEFVQRIRALLETPATLFVED
ncbi:2-oxo acid dehydrogenase subunit E2 [Tsukamurella soli]|uniref:Dihydrolipoamide acetyltransferase component of pyruvate dehydrogenase complex n=1 Tax=Tsukamurella soli TaxID=644556 RepID=A0ABP8JTY3_9ACTN